MTKREIASRIYVTCNGKPRDYDVRHDMPGEAIICFVAQIDIANTIVKALRARAAAKFGKK